MAKHRLKADPSFVLRPRVKAKKGVFDADQRSLTPRQRDRFNQLLQAGIDPKVARQLAIALVKSARPPLGAAYARARRLKDEKGGDEEDTRRRVNDYLRSKGHAGVAKAGWSEADHPRNEKGEFDEGGGAGSSAGGKGTSASAPPDPSPALQAVMAEHERYMAEHKAKHEREMAELEKQMADMKTAHAAKMAQIKAKTQRTKAKIRQLDRAQNRRDDDESDPHAHHGKVSTAKGGPGSGPHPGGGTHEEVVGQLKQAARDARAKGDHARADAISQKAAALAGKYLAGARKSYAAAFVEGARERLSSINFDQLHMQARARAGGRASGTSRRAAGDEAKAALLDRRRALQTELAGIEAELKKSGPLAQEVAVDAPVVVTPKEKKRREKLGERLVDQALAAVAEKSAPQRVDVQVSARVVKSAQPDWKRIVHAVVYAPGDVDAHGDYMEAEDIEKMAHDAMRSGIYVNHEHQEGAIEADIVESYIAPQDFNLQLDGGEPYHIPKGSHVMAMHVWGDEPWQRVLSGDYAGFSLEGTALRDAA